MPEQAEVRVWDPFIRVFHWTVAIGFAVCFLTEDDQIGLHVWSGYLIALLLGLRILWGLVGPRAARFADFVYRPTKVFAYLADLVRFRAPRHLGHSPAGGAMVVALILSLAATCLTGAALYAVRDNAGPLAGVLGTGVLGAGMSAPDSGAGAVAPRSEDVQKNERTGRGARQTRPGAALKGVHELFANLTLALVIAHLAGVLLASIVHRENLVRAMITGRKRPLATPPANST